MGRHVEADVLRGLHVLVVDDDADSREVLEAILVYSGALVTSVASADEALQVLHRIMADAALIDIEMPERDGYALLAAMRAAPTLREHMPVTIAITAYGATHPPERTRAAGFDTHMAKPIDPWRLIRTIVDLVSRRGQA